MPQKPIVQYRAGGHVVTRVVGPRGPMLRVLLLHFQRTARFCSPRPSPPFFTLLSVDTFSGIFFGDADVTRTTHSVFLKSGRDLPGRGRCFTLHRPSCDG